MADFEWLGAWKNPRSRNHLIADSVKVQRALRAAAGAVYGPLAAGHFAHKDTGASEAFLKRERDKKYGNIDYYVGIDDEQGHWAAYNIFLIAMGLPHRSTRKKAMKRSNFKHAGRAVKRVEERWNDDQGG